MNLVFVSAGKNSLHNLYTGSDKYDVVLLAYEDFKPEKNVIYIRSEGNKFSMAKKYLTSDIINKYEQFLFIDDDVIINKDEIEKIFELAQSKGLGLYHPAINPKNYELEIMYKLPDVKIHKQNWMEIMCVGMNQFILKHILSTFDINESGWGLPDLWHYFLSKNFGDDLFAIIDEVEIIHSKSQYKGAFYNDKNVNKDYIDLITAIGQNPYKRPELKRTECIYSNPILTIITIYCKKDEKYLKEYQECLPNFSHNIIFETVHESRRKEFEGIEDLQLYEPHILKKDRRFTIGMMLVPDAIEDFDFSKAQNVLLDMVDTKWILKLDADERLLGHQLKEMQSWLRDEELHYKIGGYYLTQDNIMFNTISEYGVFQRGGVPTCRLFRNDKRIRYWSAIHETVDKNILESGYQIKDSTLHIHHLGYESSVDEMVEKCIRNIKILWKNPELMNNVEKFNYMINTCNFYKLLTEVNNGNTNKGSPTTRG